jgi:hypothetical protein
MIFAAGCILVKENKVLIVTFWLWLTLVVHYGKRSALRTSPINSEISSIGCFISLDTTKRIALNLEECFWEKELSVRRDICDGRSGKTRR